MAQDIENTEFKYLQFLMQSITFGEKQCKMVSIRDLTTLYQLRLTKNKNQMLEMLNSTLSHEMMQPLSCVVFFSEQLALRDLEKQGKQMCRMISSSAKLLRC